MKHSDSGIEVFLQVNGTRVKEFTNTNPNSHPSVKQCRGPFGSRIIAAKLGAEFDIVVRFDSRFRGFSSDGVIITIATRTADDSGETLSQDTWLDIDHIHGDDHAFSTCTFFASQNADAAVNEQCIRIPVCDPNYENATSAWIADPGIWANPGCISVAIARGRLLGNDDDQLSYEWCPTDPPRAYKDMARPRKLVRMEWFRALSSENGLPFTFEYRNVPPEHIAPDAVEADPEIEHQPDFDSDVGSEEAGNESMERCAKKDPWGAADYEGVSKFEAYYHHLTRRGSASARSSKRRRSALVEDDDDPSNATHTEQSEHDEDLVVMREHRSILPAVSRHRTAETLPERTLETPANRSSTQEPTPPPERSQAVRIATNFNQARPVSTAPSTTASAQSPTIRQSPAVTEPNVPIDLTSADERPLKVESESVVEHSPPVAPPNNNEDGSEDISDMEDEREEIQLRRQEIQLRQQEIQLRRKIRAAKKRKTHARSNV